MTVTLSTEDRLSVVLYCSTEKLPTTAPSAMALESPPANAIFRTFFARRMAVAAARLQLSESSALDKPINIVRGDPGTTKVSSGFNGRSPDLNNDSATFMNRGSH